MCHQANRERQVQCLHAGGLGCGVASGTYLINFFSFARFQPELFADIL